LDGSTTAIDDPLFSKKCELDYVEMIYNNETGVVTGTVFTSNALTVINAYREPYMAGPMPVAALLSDKRIVSLYPDSHDWVRCYGAYNISITYHISDGTTVAGTAIIGTDKLVPCGPAQLTLPSGCVKYVLGFATGEQILYRLLPPILDVSERIDIYYLEPKGSWSVMTFKGVQEERIDKNVHEIHRSGLSSIDPTTILRDHGRSVVNHRSWLSFKLRKIARTDGDNIEQMRAFANARQYRAVFKGAVAPYDQVLSPIIIDNSGMRISNLKSFYNMEINGFFAVDLTHG